MYGAGKDGYGVRFSFHFINGLRVLWAAEGAERAMPSHTKSVPLEENSLAADVGRGSQPGIFLGGISLFRIGSIRCEIIQD